MSGEKPFMNVRCGLLILYLVKEDSLPFGQNPLPLQLLDMIQEHFLEVLPQRLLAKGGSCLQLRYEISRHPTDKKDRDIFIRS